MASPAAGQVVPSAHDDGDDEPAGRTQESAGARAEGRKSAAPVVAAVTPFRGEPGEPDTSANSGPARGEFDPDNNYWSAGRGGMFVKFDTNKKRIFEYRLPIPYASLYSTNVDRNGEVWAGAMHAGRYLRFNPKTEQWTEYVLPEPYGIDRETWIDNSTNPVTVWYVDHEGWIVRIQPLE